MTRSERLSWVRSAAHGSLVECIHCRKDSGSVSLFSGSYDGSVLIGHDADLTVAQRDFIGQ